MSPALEVFFAPGKDDMNIQEIELASRFAWPALEEQELPYGVLRYSSGYSKRANSLNLLPGIQAEPAEGQKHVMTIRLPAVTGNITNRGSGNSKEYSLPNWLQTYHRLSGLSGRERKIHRQMLGKLPAEHCLLAVEDESGQPLCCGFTVVVGRAAGLYNIVTHADARGRGYGTQLASKLLTWAADNEATYAYLQVEAGNFPAIKLYRKLGFRTFYSYWYRTREFSGSGTQESRR